MLLTIDFSFPLTDPVLKFLLILIIILAAPIVLNRFKIPHLLGLIIAGAIVGPNGFNILDKDSSITLLGTTGLLYIMFLAGLEIDMGDFKRNSGKSLVFGTYTFLIPMALGTVAGYFLLGFEMNTSVLLASMFASHTLITYPIVSKLGITKDPSVVITVGGTMITDTLALLVLAVIVGMVTGGTDSYFWLKLGSSVILFSIVVLCIFPIISRSFFKLIHDNISQYIFVLVMLFFGSFLAEVAGMEAIIGAFLTGLALNRLIPGTSPLMNRIEFVGNSIFIPIFLISVGMLIDYRAFFTDTETIKVGVVMIVVATVAKLLAAWFTQKTFRLSLDQRRVIFGLSNAQAAATLAAVMVGYNVILGQTPDGEPIRLLNESVLNGTILMILATCTIASFVTQKGAHNIAALQSDNNADKPTEKEEHILIPVSNEETVEELVCLSMSVMPKNKKGTLYGLNVISNQNAGESRVKKAEALLAKASKTAAAADFYMKKILRYDINISNAVTGVIFERNISDIVLGLSGASEKGLAAIFSEHITEGLLTHSQINVLVYKPVQPFSTLRQYHVLVPADAEKELGFNDIIGRLRNILLNTGSRAIVYAYGDTLDAMKKRFKHMPGVSFTELPDWSDFPTKIKSVGSDDCIFVILSRKNGISYNKNMPSMISYLNRTAVKRSIILAYPSQASMSEGIHYLT